MGGSGSINAMIYTKGLKQDYVNWSSKTCDLWSWNNINAAYKAIEQNISNVDYSNKKNNDKLWLHSIINILINKQFHRSRYLNLSIELKK